MKHVIPLELIELEEFNYHLAIKSVFKEGTEALWVIDTGASKTVFDWSLAENYDAIPPEEETIVRSAGIGNDQLDTTLGMLHEFYLGDLLIPPIKVALIDLSHINTLYYHATEKEICGLIGSDFLLENKAVIDYARLKITLNIKKNHR
jgi:hypothetical protein